MAILDYSSSAVRPESILRRLVVVDTCVFAGVMLYCYAGTKLAQSYERSEYLSTYATGTSFYETWLMLVPTLCYSVFQVGVCANAVLQAFRKRWPAETTWILPIAFVEWLLFLLVCLPLFENASP